MFQGQFDLETATPVETAIPDLLFERTQSYNRLVFSPMSVVAHDDVHLFGFTGGDGMFGAYGYVTTDEEVGELKKFMERTSPPRPGI